MRRLFLVIIETFLLLVIGFAATNVRMRGDTSYELFSRRGWMKVLLVMFVIQLAFYLFDLYDLRVTRSYRRVITNLAMALVAATVLLSILFYALPMLQLGRGIFLVAIAFVAILIPAWRLMVAWSQEVEP